MRLGGLGLAPSDDVARYIVDHLDEAAFLTAEELARRASTSSSTVVRFSQALGFDGYPELQQSAIEEYRDAGCTHIMLELWGDKRHEQIRLFGEHVLPHFRG